MNLDLRLLQSDIPETVGTVGILRPPPGNHQRSVGTPVNRNILTSRKLQHLRGIVRRLRQRRIAGRRRDPQHLDLRRL